MTRASDARFPDGFKAESVGFCRESGKVLRAMAEARDGDDTVRHQAARMGRCGALGAVRAR